MRKTHTVQSFKKENAKQELVPAFVCPKKKTFYQMFEQSILLRVFNKNIIYRNKSHEYGWIWISDDLI